MRSGTAAASARNGNHLATFGVISTPVASGAVFLEIDHIARMWLLRRDTTSVDTMPAS